MMMSAWRAGGAAFTAALVLSSCTDPAAHVARPAEAPAFAVSSEPALDEGYIRHQLQQMNAQLAARGLNLAIDRVEMSFVPSAHAANPNVVFFFDRSLRIGSRWVPNDARRLADGTNITYAHFVPFLNATDAGFIEPSLDAAFDTWNSVTCSKLPLVKRTLAPNVYPGFVDQSLFGLSGLVWNPFAADIITLGFIDGMFFDLLLGPGARDAVLGVTITLVFTDAAGNPTDIDANGRLDTGIKEIWYNNDFSWSTNGTGDADVESTALHEEGHALELGHFGRIAVNTKIGRLNVSPRAVMNAVIFGLRTPLGTDNGAYCGNWAYWPN